MGIGKENQDGSFPGTAFGSASASRVLQSRPLIPHRCPIPDARPQGMAEGAARPGLTGSARNDKLKDGGMRTARSQRNRTALFFAVPIIRGIRKGPDFMPIQKREFHCYRNCLRIRGTVFFPEGGENLPAAVVSHGFMSNRRSVFPYARALAEAGFAAFCFDFCGGGLICASEGSRRNMSVLTEVEDLKQVIRFALNQPDTDGKTLILMGCSQGGTVSALTAAELKEAVRGLILLYPALSIPDDARKGQMIGAKFDPEHIPDRLQCGPMPLGRRYVEDVIGMDINQAIAGYTGSVRILHGDRDEIVDAEYSRQAARAWCNAGADVRCTIIRGGDHGFSKRVHRDYAAEQAAAFARQLTAES